MKMFRAYVWGGLAMSLIMMGCSPRFSQPDKNTMNTDAWVSSYFGRFTLRMPAESVIKSSYKIFGQELVLTSKNAKYQLPVEVARKIEQLKKGNAGETSAVYERSVQLDRGSVVLVSKLHTTYVLHGYFLTDRNTMFTMVAKPISSEGVDQAIDRLRLLSQSIYFRVPGEAPPPNAFAIEAGHTTLDAERWAEQSSMGAQIAGHPGTYIGLITQSVSRPEQTLLERYKSNTAKLSTVDSAMKLLGMTEVIRKRKLEINGIMAEELAIKARIEGKVIYQFQVEYQGTPNSNRMPYIALELGTHEIGSDFESDEDALVFWDAVVGSLKPIS
ncbi:MAG: hypothetical protein JWP80_1037 [Pseudomonas sp.]|nr:hypothetical protein [Pseudomonas sp.]